jgi:hypothetical protein
MLDGRLHRFDRPAQKAQPLLNSRQGLGKPADPVADRPGQQLGDNDKQRHQRQHDDQRGQGLRQARPQQEAQHRPTHQVQHKGEQDRQDDRGGDIGGGERRQRQQAAEKNRAQPLQLFALARLGPGHVGRRKIRIRWRRNGIRHVCDARACPV